MLLETLRDQHDLRFPIKDIDLLADEFGTSEQKVRVTICNYGLFDVDENEQFFSPKMIIFLEPYFKGREQRKKAIESRWSKNQESKLIDYQEDNTAVLRPNYDRNTDVIQKKRKESKVNESKGEESKEKEKKANTAFFVPAYEEFEEYALSVKPLIDKADLKRKYESWILNDWHDGNGNKIKNWKLKLNSTIPYIRQVNQNNTPPTNRMVY